MGVVCNSVVVVFMQFVLVLNLVLLMAKRSIAKYSSGSKIREREREPFMWCSSEFVPSPTSNLIKTLKTLHAA